MTAPRSVAIVGLGLIGGSIAAGLKARDKSVRITAFDTDPSSLELGLSQGAIDAGFDAAVAAAEGAELVVLSVPVGAMAEVMRGLDVNATITDVGSVKSSVLIAAEAAFGHLPPGFVPGHPIAGSERHGMAAANPALFEGRKVILTPTTESAAKAVTTVEDMWQALGAEVVQMEPAHHDDVLAQTSHLPHLLAYALVDTLSRQGERLEIFEYAAGGFRDFSRIAASDPVMWRDVFRANGEPVLAVLDKFMAELGDLRGMIAAGEADALHEVFTRAKAARDHFAALDQARDGSQ